MESAEEALQAEERAKSIKVRLKQLKQMPFEKMKPSDYLEEIELKNELRELRKHLGPAGVVPIASHPRFRRSVV
jgi:hypothetical protein